MKKLNKKGFTIVELVIVIAVIGILSAVLIPTFSNLTKKAEESAALQDVTNAHKNWLIENAEKGTEISTNLIFVSSKGYDFKYDGNKFVAIDGEIKYADNSSFSAVTETPAGLGNYFNAFDLYTPVANN